MILYCIYACVLLIISLPFWASPETAIITVGAIMTSLLLIISLKSLGEEDDE